MQSSAPTLVIISGAPATGKTTLANRLASDLRLPILAKDELNEALADAIGTPPDVSASMRLPSHEDIRDFAALPRASLVR